MKIKFLKLVLFYLLFSVHSYSKDSDKINDHDSSEVIKLNKQAYNSRLTNPNQTVSEASKALAIATKINYVDGLAESNRVLGIGYYYLNEPEKAINVFLVALKYFKDDNNLDGQAKVSNNIGNLYRETDYDKALEYFSFAKDIALKVKDEELIGTIYLNFGNVYYRKKNFYKALEYYDKSNEVFTKLNNIVNLIQCQQNRGVIYYNLNQLDKAKELLLEANKQAKEKDLNFAVASINLTLTSIFTAKNEFALAEQYLKEGMAFAEIVKSSKLEYDYKLTSYYLEFRRHDYKAALFILRDIYKQDSVTYKNNVSIKLNLLNAQNNQRETEHRNEIILEQQKNDRILFWLSTLIAVLLSFVIILLISYVNRKAKTNKHLTALNQKITEQKENLNQINHHLEEIIDERTKDLQVKNKKLADYSLHLSHQIRGPIATLKGLLNLEKDSLIEPDECLKLMNKCVSEIDDNIIDMSSMLHEPASKF